jgi:outer membrane protein OmpA-like peptidoglycan-associated protein
LYVVASLALAQSLFGPPDDDGDGVSDLVDECLSLPETRNDYADDDGCPDYLSSVMLHATYQGERLEADWYGINDGTGWRQATSSPHLPFVPGRYVRVAAERDCLEGQSATRLRDSATLELELVPVWDATVELSVRDLEGAPVPDARIEWLGVSTPGCAPSSVDLPLGTSTLTLGQGEHLVRIAAPGFAPEVASLSLGSGRTEVIVVSLDVEPRLVDTLARVHFETDSAALSASAREALDEVATWIAAHPEARPEVVIEGHADERGSDTYNHDLSLRRAQSVRDYLASKGAGAANVVLVPRGERDPLAEGSGRRAWAWNRRVEVVVD